MAMDEEALAGENEEEIVDELEGALAKGNWMEQAHAAVASGESVPGLPQGLRLRGAPDRPPAEGGRHGLVAAAASWVAKADGSSGGPTWLEVRLLLVIVVIGALVTSYSLMAMVGIVPGGRRQLSGDQTWRLTCKQCRHEWWDEFWQWRLQAQNLSLRLSHASEELVDDDLVSHWVVTQKLTA
mmetsp:Transcript_30683/g.68920  ORF Transcript_30683/g.68920 Transcript_30683/m.68920 type:complete len:183 (+) Transcript_30683:49-597(+)